MRLREGGEIALIDHVLGSDLGGLQPTGSDPSTDSFRISFGAASGLWNSQHSSTILQQVAIRPTATPMANGDIRRQPDTRRLPELVVCCQGGFGQAWRRQRAASRQVGEHSPTDNEDDLPAPQQACTWPNGELA